VGSDEASKEGTGRKRGVELYYDIIKSLNLRENNGRGPDPSSSGEADHGPVPVPKPFQEFDLDGGDRPRQFTGYNIENLHGDSCETNNNPKNFSEIKFLLENEEFPTIDETLFYNIENLDGNKFLKNLLQRIEIFCPKSPNPGPREVSILTSPRPSKSPKPQNNRISTAAPALAQKNLNELDTLLTNPNRSDLDPSKF
jgi:hypothetical protein